MVEKLAKVAENYAKKSSQNSSCVLMVLFHQPKMPKSLIKKDEV